MLDCDNSRLFENRLSHRSPPRAEVPCKISVRPKRFGGDKKASKMHSSCAEKAILSLLGKFNLSILFGAPWFAFVLDGVLSDRSNTMCQIEGLIVRIDSMSFRGSTRESLETDIFHFGF
jgi:hypothetical protein